MDKNTNPSPAWQGTTDGLPWMHQALVRVLAVVPIGVIYAVAAIFVIPFYIIGNGQGRTSQYRFFRQQMGYRPLRALWHVYVNHFRFAQVIIDRFAVYGGRRFTFEVDGLDDYNRLAEGDEGFVQVFSHTGNYELAGYELRQPRKRVYALLFSGETETIMQQRASAFAPNGVEMVFVQPDMSHIFLLSNVVRDGDIASIPGDRIFGSKKFVECQFLNGQARFPLGPFQLAAVREAPIVALFVMKEGWSRYRIIVRTLGKAPDANRQSLGARKQTIVLAQEFVSELEKVVRRYPDQWFNYYDFWNASDAEV